MTLASLQLITALVTPFSAGPGQEIDTQALSRLLLNVVEQGTQAFVLAGTTGEGPALSLDEKLLLFDVARKTLEGKDIPLIMTTGTNNTASTVALSHVFAEKGADALLVVCPYYVKPSQEGLYQHFKAVADAVPQTPIIIYNIPGRCSVTMTPETMARLATACPNIAGVKQSLNDMDAVSQIRAICPERFLVWSGDDSLTLPMLSLGAVGVISVAAHLFGREMRTLLTTFENGDVRGAEAIHRGLFPALRALFDEPNPTIVKACLAEKGLIQNELRLPLVALNSPVPSAIKAVLPMGV